MPKHAQTLLNVSFSYQEMPKIQTRWRCSWRHVPLCCCVAMLLATMMPFAVAWHVATTAAATIQTTTNSTAVPTMKATNATTTSITATAINLTAITATATTMQLVNNISAKKVQHQQKPQQQKQKQPLSNNNQQLQSISSNKRSSCCNSSNNSSENEESELFNRILNRNANLSKSLKQRPKQEQLFAATITAIKIKATTTRTTTSGPMQANEISNNNKNNNNYADNQNAINSPLQNFNSKSMHTNSLSISSSSSSSSSSTTSSPNQLLWNWKFNRTKTKTMTKRFLPNKRRNRNVTSSAIMTTATPVLPAALAPPTSDAAASLTMWSHVSLFHPPALQNLKVNQVFESERRMSRGQMQRNHGKIVLLGLFELSTKMGPRPDGLSELGAAMMAVEHINSKHLLPGYTLELVTNDTQCDPGVGVDRFFHAIYTQPATRMVMLLGSACSEVTESLAKVVPYWNIVQVSFGSTSPALSDRQEFPYFYRTVAPDSSHNPARIAFIRRFGWDTVTTFSQNEEVHSLAVNDLVTELEAANISCAATITFAETDFKEQLLLLRETDTRIIIGSFSQHLAPKILCEAYKLRMFGADYAWILHESMGAPWWSEVPTKGTHCSTSELQAAVENLIIVSSHNSIVGNNISLSGLSNDMFNKQLRKQFAQFAGPTKFTKTTKSAAARKENQQQQQHQQHGIGNPYTVAGEAGNFGQLPVSNSMSRYAPQTYDAVWAIALALRAAEEHWRKDAAAIQSKLDRFDYTRSDMAWEFLKQMGKLDFLGVSGPVSFSGPDRIGTTAFYQIQHGMLEPIALFYPAANILDFHCPRCRTVKWHSGQVPIAKRVFKVRVATIAPLAFYTIATLSSVGIALAIAFLAFNLHFRKLKAIKLSSPKLSNITAVGCIFVYAAVILLGLDYSTLPAAEDSFATVCTARVYLLSAGFSLAFGSMFAKTYRVHRIFTRTGSVFKDKMLQDIQLILLVCALLLLDGLVVTLWVVTDPMERHLNNLTLEISSIDRSVVYQPQVEVCRSQHTQTWLGALYAYKGLLLIVGVYMAWETRHVKIAALNDSQYIGVSVYSVVITSGIVVVLANLISERVTLSFITITAMILTSTTATLCLLFIPKLHDIWARNDIIDPVIHSMGLKMECNTRRFVIDDRRELQYRVEVQNRVYKKEIAALDAEIRKLERMLESGNASTATSSTTSLMFGQQKSGVTIIGDSGIHPALPPPSKNSNKSRTPSISGILPNLLLSVLPPVIPRASWPSAEYMQVPMRRSVTFASQPQLEDRSIAESCLPAQDLLNLRLAHQQATETKTSIINKLRGIFSRTTSSNKGSTNSLTEPKGLKAAFKSHMGLFTRLIPSSQTASCNAIYSVQPQDCGASTSAGPSGSSNNLKPMHRLSFAKSGTHLDVTTIDPTFLPIPIIATISAETADPLPCIDIGGKYIKPHETKVNFALPSNRRPSNVTPILQASLRERVRGSPRFPHRILPPTCSLSALEESEDRGVSVKMGRMNLQQASSAGNWKSMEVAAKSRLSLNDSEQDLNVEVMPVLEPVVVNVALPEIVDAAEIEKT